MRSLVLIALALLLTPRADAAPCPTAGASVDLILARPAGADASTAVLFGTLGEAACTDDSGGLQTGYAVRVRCDGEPSCRARVDHLLPGAWTHAILVSEGEAAGQLQGRRAQLIDASAGVHTVRWPLFRSIHTVTSLADALPCADCLRAAITAAELAAKPALIQFAPELSGEIVLAAALPPLAAGQVTLDALTLEGQPHARTLNGNGLSSAALRVTGAGNRVVGIRITNVGGDSDALLLDGAGANDNLIESVAVVGRAEQVCGTGDVVGCVVDGTCHVPSVQFPRGECGDDAIAVRNLAGTTAANVIRAADVRGARDKGVKVSDGAVAIVEQSLIENNADGGLQATLGGSLVATANVVRNHRSTFGANGLSANGAAVGGSDPARLSTRGNLSLDNALRGISIRALSLAVLRDDFACGNGTPGRGSGVGLGVFDAAGQSAIVQASGLALVHNTDAGAAVGDNGLASFGSAAAPGGNAFAFNGLPNANLRNQTGRALEAIGNQWEHCGEAIPCNTDAVQMHDVFSSGPAVVSLSPALATPNRQAPTITAIDPPFAAAGELVRIYGSGFDAINGAGASCSTIPDANTCRPVRGNCVMIDRQPAAVVAATPTMLVVRAPFTCIAPVQVATRTRLSRGFARAAFCTLPPDAS
ncbi:MAG: hypothetical protein SF182_17885 [Deltaproteobacteria bacterium]|nr:hypothetical protein [Deltaproteobacteria bacterium]